MNNFRSFFSLIFNPFSMKKSFWVIVIIILLVICFFVLSKHPSAWPTVPSLATWDVWVVCSLSEVCAKTYVEWINIPVLKTFSSLCDLQSAQKASATVVNLLYSWACIPSEPVKTASGTYILTVQTTDKYVVKTEEGGRGNDVIMWQNIYVYDLSWKEILSFFAVNELSNQYFDSIVWNTLIADYGTSPDRSFNAYDIPSKQKVFEDRYHTVYTWLWLDGNTMNYYSQVWSQNATTKPQNAPTCTGGDNWYMQLKTLDLLTRKIIKIGPLQCTYFE